MLRRSLMIDQEKDTVAVVLENAFKGDTIKTPKGTVVLLEDVEFAHKVTVVDLGANEKVYKYGHEIGYVENATPKGTWIHSHNMKCDRGKKTDC